MDGRAPCVEALGTCDFVISSSIVRLAALHQMATKLPLMDFVKNCGSLYAAKRTNWHLGSNQLDRLSSEISLVPLIQTIHHVRAQVAEQKIR
ncbi:hypothetical protein BQ8794_50264 [Mesorhizobium prunaredense]|uniref:Uncharacterized protein n=1 Tax=Mesorhizobium prunaredense TaxID=1631249 RepID=A0A1R3VFY2_9HYPH|nr:hypothetical protein [Mesorhizobium prunaredense]SIT58162.1 hypothetical protein BQ8794_50264 [Mesorhizobium prunaredense]